MSKTKKTLWTVLLLWLIMATTAYSDEGPITKLFFKNGSVIKCDMVWEGPEHAILSMRSGKITGYSIDEIDLEKTFGKVDGKDIAERYEAERKKRELMSTLSKPKQYRARGKQLERVNKHDKSIELEKRFLQNKLKTYEEKYRKAPGPPPKGYSGIDKKGFYRRKIESIEKKIEELERDPEFYFYEKSQKRDEKSHATFFVPTAGGGAINTKTGEVLAPTVDGGAVSTRDGTYYAPAGGGFLVNTKTGEVIP